MYNWPSGKFFVPEIVPSWPMAQMNHSPSQHTFWIFSSSFASSARAQAASAGAASLSAIVA